ncbi:MAG: hypothetical protein K9I37_04495 [Crocinitomicaceae bacterium]|nr:hypothetical protein [Crocinitomicaceae bacterium]
MKYFFQVIFFFSFTAYSQLNLGVVTFDTLSYAHKTNGSLDSIDQQSQSSSRVFPLNSPLSLGSFLDPFSMLSPAGNVFHVPYNKRSILHYTALPHIGVAYSFGSQGAQHLTFTYSQVFRKDWVVNLKAANNASTGFYRNSAWKSSDYTLAIAKNSRIYSFRFDAGFSQESRNLSNGIVADSLAPLYSLTLIPVKKENAYSNSTLRTIQLANFIDFSAKDSSRFFGLTFHTKLSSLDRYYHEEDQLDMLYSLIQYDSSSTSDHYGVVDLTNKLGIGYKTRTLFFNMGVNSNYWRYTNQGPMRDTLELGLFYNGTLKFGNWRITNDASYNLIGAKNAWSVISSASWQKERHYLFIENSNGQIAPRAFQRFYQANNCSYSLSDFSLQKVYSIQGLVREKLGKHFLALSYNWQASRQVYVYDGQSWVNNANLSQQVLGQVGLNGTIKLGTVEVSPSYLLTLMDKEYQFYPMHMISARTMVNGGIFKAKKLKALAALDIMYSSSYRAARLIPTMTIIDFSNLPNSVVQKPLLNAGVLIGLEIETFRFFARLDNIAYFISDRSQLFMEGYTLPTWQIKFGITWDFWN